ncbi:MAG TPA: Na+/H+ antiporter subunit D [bacterium]|nr:Na+/H+ antiporter subunit D [bacterium]
MNALIPFPILLPLFTAIILMLSLRWQTLQKYISLAGSIALLIISILIFAQIESKGIQAVQIGNWPAPFGITIVADLFSAIMIIVTAIMGIAINIYSFSSIDINRQRFGYYPLLNGLLMGVCGAFLTGDVFNLYVWFEVMLMSSFVLMVLGGEKAQMEGGIKYVTINLFSSAIYLSGLGILYGQIGTLNMADLAFKIRTLPDTNVLNIVAMLFMVAFGIKAAVFPMFFWLPASYHTPPAAVSAIFAGLLTKVGVYAMIRSFSLFFVVDVDFTRILILWIAGLSMLSGVLAAATQYEFRRLLSFHIISQIGYMIMGLGLSSKLAIAGSIFHIIHNIFAKTNLFLIAGVVHRLKGTYDLKKLGGFYKNYPILALLFVIPAFSLAGIPPLSGFWAKFILIKAGLELQQYVIVIVALIVSILTLYSMTKIWAELFLKAEPSTGDNKPLLKPELSLLVPVVLLAGLTVIIGIWTEPFFNILMRAAEQLINPAEYIHAVLGVQL